MDGSDKPPFVMVFPLWIIVYRKMWLEGGLSDSIAMVATTEGHFPAVFTDEHLALEFIEDSKHGDWSAVIIRDAAECLVLARILAEGGIPDVGIDNPYPGTHPERFGWLIPTPHFLERLEN
jgi:hypothetical protein